MKVVLILGATGLVGQNLVKACCSREDVSVVKIFVRKNMTQDELKNKFGPIHKIEIHAIDFDSLSNIAGLIQGDIFISALGSTLKKAKTKDKFFHIDHGYNFSFAKLAKKNGINTMGIVSSIGADSKSRSFYLKTKGILERDLGNIRFKKLVMVRPSFLLGERGEVRLGEKIGIQVFQKLRPVMFGPFKRYAPVGAKEVAHALIDLCFADQEIKSGLEYERKIIV